MDDRTTFKPLPMFSTQLVHELAAEELLLPVELAHIEKLYHELGKDCYTYLTISNGCDSEVVEARYDYGHIVVKRDSQCRTWPCGTRVEFHITECGLHDMLNQAMPVQPDAEEECTGFDGTMCVGRWDYHFKNGWLEKRVCSNRMIPRGFTDNPVLCFDEDGCLTEVGEGSSQVSRSHCW